MKIFWKTIALIIPFLFYVLTSCSSESDEVDVIMDVWNWDEYIDDNSQIRCRNVVSFKNDSIIFSGVKKRHLWYAICSKSSKEILFEWEDKIEIDAEKIQIFKGYGEYVYAKIESITPSFYQNIENGEIVSICLNLSIPHPPILYITSFTNRGNALHQYGTCWRSWYSESVVLREYAVNDVLVNPTLPLFPFYVVCDFKGNILFKYSDMKTFGIPTSRFFLNEVELISNTEAICQFSDHSIMRWDYVTSLPVWNTNISVPFDVSADSNPKFKYLLLDRSTNIWSYKVEITYFDGTKRDFSFTINIDTGELNNIV